MVAASAQAMARISVVEVAAEVAAAAVVEPLATTQVTLHFLNQAQHRADAFAFSE
tara:strand:- start:268 stop:432 length:165 start_codon:yes stop_codon:yes gene_type:complete